jgi:general stress protein CsbA
MEPENLSPEESFDIITKAISNFKMNYKESAQIYLLWGWILTLASLSNFIIIKILQSKEALDIMVGNWERTGLFIIGNWVVFVLAGVVIMHFMRRQTKKVKKVYSHLESYINKLWTVTGISFFIAAVICIKMGIIPPAIMLLLAGMATTTSGLLTKFRPVIFGGIAFFIFSIAVTFVSNEYLSLISAVAIICGYLIPGYILKSAKE